MVTRLLQARNTETRNHAAQTKRYRSHIAPFFWSLCKFCTSLRIKTILSWSFQDHVVLAQDFASAPEWKTWSWNKFLHTNWCHTAPLHWGKCARKYLWCMSNIRRSGGSIFSISTQVRSSRSSPKSVRDTLVVCWCSDKVELESAHTLNDLICMCQCNASNIYYFWLRLPSDDTKTKPNRAHVEGGRDTPPG